MIIVLQSTDLNTTGRIENLIRWLQLLQVESGSGRCEVTYSRAWSVAGSKWLSTLELDAKVKLVWFLRSF